MQTKEIRYLDGFMTNQQCDFLQETFCTQRFTHYFNANWRGKVVHACTDSNHSRGVCILFNDNSHINIIDKHACNDGRGLLVNVEIDETPLLLFVRMLQTLRNLVKNSSKR